MFIFKNFAAASLAAVSIFSACTLNVFAEKQYTKHDSLTVNGTNIALATSELTTNDMQYTVVIIDKANENATLDADMIYYINQGTNADSFWSAMGVKSDIVETVDNVSSLANGNYLVRVGGENITDTQGNPTVLEFALTVEDKATEPVGTTYYYGNVDNSIGRFGPTVNINDALEVLKYYNGDSTSAISSSKAWTIAVANVDDSTGRFGPTVNVDDALEILKYYNNQASCLTDAQGNLKTYIDYETE